ncbi:MmcB family DNA repair protein [Devosia sp. J2-20]|uniref:MmcB family DNA repair protein n=1 Tax=Devosia sp. J2-20 TaxID=3026161 RepID=UPI0032B826AA
MAEDLPPIVDLRQSATALRVQRGVMRLLRESFDMACFAEVTLKSGRRADVLGIGPKGEIWIVEIKSSLIDFQVDRKWPEYRDFSDKFFLPSRPSWMPISFRKARG